MIRPGRTLRGTPRYTIDNRTHYRTADLRAFVVRASRLVFTTSRDRDFWIRRGERPVRIVVVYTHDGGFGHGSSGHAWRGGPARVRLSKSVDRVDKTDFAGVIAHELGHVKGIDHDGMKGLPLYSRRAPGHRQLFGWAEELPLQVKPAKRKPTADDRRAAKIAAAQKHVANWAKKKKLATTKLAKWTRRLKQLERLDRAAAERRGDS